MRTIALVGAESTGKTTLGLMLTGRLRTRGALAEFCSEGKNLPFAPDILDTSADAWTYRIAHKIQAEELYRVQARAEFLICDRTALDFALYAHAKGHSLQRGVKTLVVSLFDRYDTVFYLPLANTVYREDGFRAPAEQNTWREKFDEILRARLDARKGHTVWVPPAFSYRERSEYVYHHILFNYFNDTRPLRAVQQVREWLHARGHRIQEVRLQGSNSLERFHPPSDRDDIDLMVVVQGDANYAIEVRKDFLEHQEQLENVVQASLDLLFTPLGLEAYEV